VSRVETPKNKAWYPDLEISDYQFVIYDIEADAVIHEFDITCKYEFKYALKVLKYHREERKDNVFFDVLNREYQRIGEENE
tara:strand:- start:244 stop:486 length:243 start_codon:yes stop_codon:yes gene_type:complete